MGIYKQDRRWQKRHIWLYLGEDLHWLNGKVLTEEDLQRLNGTKCWERKRITVSRRKRTSVEWHKALKTYVKCWQRRHMKTYVGWMGQRDKDIGLRWLNGTKWWRLTLAEWDKAVKTYVGWMGQSDEDLRWLNGTKRWRLTSAEWDKVMKTYVGWMGQSGEDLRRLNGTKWWRLT